MSAAPRPVESAPSYGDVGVDPLAGLRRLDIFRSLTAEEYERIAKSAKIVRIPQDRVVPRGGEGPEEPAYYFVLKGQVAFAEFHKGSLPKGPINPKKRAQPLMQISKKNVALFETNDFFANDHVAEALGDDGKKGDLALYTLVPVVLLHITRKVMDEVLATVPAVKDEVEARAEAAYYRQTLLKIEGRSDILDFYVKEGFEYAQAIKVIQADKCIDCDQCIVACEDRHGVARIERFGPRIGLIQFTLNCRTCVDARCIDPCNFDAIGFDEQAKEVIVYDNCVGCTLCAKACPHEAIRMVDIPDAPAGSPSDGAPVDIVAVAKRAAKKAAGGGEGEAAPAGRPKGTVVAKGEEADVKAKKKPKRIANKCDHCIGYADMACISACPTGAIVQIDPRALFRRDGGLVERADKYFDPSPFEVGWSQAARAQGVALMHLLFFVVGIGVLACTYEVIARRAKPALSLWRMAVAWLEGPEAARMLVLTYSAGQGMGRLMGYAGAIMMTLSALYTFRLHVPGLRRIGSSRTWFDFHVVFGLAGPVFALLHSGLHIFQLYWVVYLVWVMLAVVVSGIVGRYLYTAVPRALAAVDRDKKRLDEGIRAASDQWSSMTRTSNVLEQFMKAQEKLAAAPKAEAQGPRGFALLGSLLAGELKRVRGARALRSRVLAEMKNRQLKSTAIELMSRRAAIDREKDMIGAVQQLLSKWRAVHIALSLVLFALLAAHVGISIWATGF